MARLNIGLGEGLWLCEAPSPNPPSSLERQKFVGLFRTIFCTSFLNLQLKTKWTRCSHGDNDIDYAAETWDAMTDGMYGDMPDGFDDDYSFLGH